MVPPSLHIFNDHLTLPLTLKTDSPTGARNPNLSNRDDYYRKMSIQGQLNEIRAMEQRGSLESIVLWGAARSNRLPIFRFRATVPDRDHN